jgi:hypothetical protein
MIPLVAWLLIRHPQWRLPFCAIAAASVLFAASTGHLGAWVGVTLASTSEMGVSYQYGPSAIIGWWWMLAGVPLSLLAFWKGNPATAGLLLQPYWLPYYLVLPVADFRQTSVIASSHAADSSATGNTRLSHSR